MYKFMSFKGATNIVLNSLLILVILSILTKMRILPSLNLNSSWSGSGSFNPVLTNQADTSAALKKYTVYGIDAPAVVRKSSGFFTTR